MKIKRKKQINLFSKHMLLILITITMLLPIFWMVNISFKTADTVFDTGISSLTGVSIDGYLQVFEQIPFFTWASNSLFLAVVMTIGQVIIAFLAAYAFSRYDFSGRNVLFYFVLATMIIPPQATMIPIFITISKFDWVNTFTGVIVPQLASGYAIFLMRQFFLGIPKELSEAASIDGCGELGILWHIYVPAAIPALAALSIILFVHHWNDYYLPLMILTDKAKLTLPIALSQFQNEGSMEWIPIMAVSTLSTIPVLILYFFTQKKFVEGMTSSGLKG